MSLEDSHADLFGGNIGRWMEFSEGTGDTKLRACIALRRSMTD
jgi:hypothetical protein